MILNILKTITSLEKFNIGNIGDQLRFLKLFVFKLQQNNE